MLESLLTIATVATMALAPGSAPIDRPAALADGFVQAWNAHDGPSFGRLYADDADWVTAGGLRLKGRAEIQAFLEKEHATWAKATSMTAMSTDVRSLRPDVAVIHLRWEISGSTDRDGQPASPYRGTNLLIATREREGWRIVAGQVNRETRSSQD